MNVFINFSNHPSVRWDRKQIELSESYGKIIDIPFPSVDPSYGEKEIELLADKYVDIIMSYQPQIVMCQGEYTFCFKVVEELKKKGIRVVAACSQRDVIETDQQKISTFHFVRYREY